jgi:hypothetical protein
MLVNPHTQWFAELGKSGGPALEVRTVDGARTWGVWLSVAQSGPARTTAVLDAERLRRELTELIDTAYGPSEPEESGPAHPTLPAGEGNS